MHPKQVWISLERKAEGIILLNKERMEDCCLGLVEITIDNSNNNNRMGRPREPRRRKRKMKRIRWINTWKVTMDSHCCPLKVIK